MSALLQWAFQSLSSWSAPLLYFLNVADRPLQLGFVVNDVQKKMKNCIFFLQYFVDSQKCPIFAPKECYLSFTHNFLR